MPSHHPRIGEGMDVGEFTSLGEGERRAIGVVPYRAFDTDFGAESAGRNFANSNLMGSPAGQR